MKIDRKVVLRKKMDEVLEPAVRAFSKRELVEMIDKARLQYVKDMEEEDARICYFFENGD